MRLRFLLAAALSAALVAPAILVAPAAAQTVVKLGSATNSIGSLPLIVAEQKGLFAAEGLKVEIVDFKGGAPAVQALAGGGVAFCICAGDHALRLRTRGLPAKIVTGLTEKHGYALLALASNPATDLASLKGKKVGITSSGSLTDNTLRSMFPKAGIDPNKDVEILGVGTGVAMKASVDSGAVAAGMFTTPDVQSALAEAGKYKVVADYRELPYASLDLIVLETWLKANDATAKKLVSAVVKAQTMINADPAVALSGVKGMFPTFDAKLADLVAKDTPGNLARGGLMSEEAFKNMVDILGATEPALKTVTYADVFTKDYLPKP